MTTSMLGKQRITPLLFCLVKLQIFKKEDRSMIITIRSQATSEDRAQLMALLCRITGSQRPIATTHIDASEVIALDGNTFDTQASLLLSQQSAVEHVLPLKTPYQLVSRAF
jgi:3-deoxy-7-phosphoheptulonate synthase